MKASAAVPAAAPVDAKRISLAFGPDFAPPLPSDEDFRPETKRRANICRVGLVRANWPRQAEQVHERLPMRAVATVDLEKTFIWGAEGA